jgi:hypothetical protein
VRTREFADLLERDGEALVLLREGGLVRVGPVAAAVLELAVNPIDLGSLAGALERRFGAPDEVAGVRVRTWQVVAELADRGLVDLGEPPLPSGSGRWWRISDDAAFIRPDPRRVVVLNLASPADQPRALLDSGATIWSCLTGDGEDRRPWISESDVLDDLAAAYGLPRAEIEPDVIAFLDGLADEGLMVRAGDQRAATGSSVDA